MKNKISKKKIRKKIKIHMYNKGVIHFEYLNENLFVEKLVTKYGVTKDYILKQYIRLGIVYMIKNKKTYLMDAIINHVNDENNVSSLSDKNISFVVIYSLMCDVMEVSILTGKNFNHILLICAKLDVCIVSKLKSENVYNLDVINEAILNG